MQPELEPRDQINQMHTLTDNDTESARFMTKVYLWMAFALVLTGSTSVIVYETGYFMRAFLDNSILFYGLLIAELAIVFSFLALSKRVSAVMNMVLFYIYSISVGLTLSIIFLVYATSSIASMFFFTAVGFAGLSAFGYFTKKDLDKIGKIAIMSLFGIVAAGIYNLFVGSETISLVTAIIGVPTFAILTAYDTQKIKNENIVGNEGSDEDNKEAIRGALSLYLDFINLFLKLLRLFGKRR